MNDYKKMIIQMLNKINSERTLKRIYNFICRVTIQHPIDGCTFWRPWFLRGVFSASGEHSVWPLCTFFICMPAIRYFKISFVQVYNFLLFWIVTNNLIVGFGLDRTLQVNISYINKTLRGYFSLFSTRRRSSCWQHI